MTSPENAIIEKRSLAERFVDSIKDAREQVRKSEENRDIAVKLEGKWLGPAGFAQPFPANERPAPLSAASRDNIDTFTPNELSQAVKLSILTVDTLTEEQRIKFSQADTKLPLDTQHSMLEKLTTK